MPAVGLRDVLGKLEATDPRYATEAVERVLAEAQATGASDVHFQPGRGRDGVHGGGSMAFCIRLPSCR